MKNKTSKKNRKNSSFSKKKKLKKSQNTKSNTINKKTRKIQLRGGMENEETLCLICFENLDGHREEYTLICGRIPHGPFHKECMANWCRDKDRCSCPICRRILDNNELRDLGLINEREMLTRRKKRWIEGYIQRIRDKLTRNDVPPIPEDLREQIPDYIEGGPRARFLDIILILIEELSQELQQDLFNSAIGFIYEATSEIMDDIDENVRYTDNDLYHTVKIILNEIVNELNIVG